MNKKLIILGVAVSLMFVTSCGKKEKVDEDVMLTEPEIVTEVGKTTQSDNENKLIVDGFWVSETKGKTDTWYRYIPMLKEKIPGVFDFEDSELNKDTKYYEAYNRPKGTEICNRGNYHGTAFMTNPNLGYNSDTRDEEVKTNDLLRAEEGWFFGENRNREVDFYQKCDVECITIATYEELYGAFPDMKLQIYGIGEKLWGEYMGEKSTWTNEKHLNFLRANKEAEYTMGNLLGEKTITESGVFYVDYKELSKRGNYAQYMIVIRFSESIECAYNILIMPSYEITDETLYNTWKQEHINQFIENID